MAALLTHDDILLTAFAVADVDPAVRSKVIFTGMIAAVVLRLGLAFAGLIIAGQVSSLFSQSAGTTPSQALSLLIGTSVIGMTLAVGLLRILRSWKIYRTITVGELSGEERAKPYTDSFWWPVSAVLAAEFAAAIEIVVFNAGASGGIWWLFVSGVVLTIMLKTFASETIAAIFTRYPWITWIGLLVILYVALDMIYSGSHEVICATYGIGCSETLWQGVLHGLGLGP